MRKIGLLSVALAVGLVLSEEVKADFIFSFSDALGDHASGTLTSTDVGGGAYLATGGTVTVTGPAAGMYTLVPGGPGIFSIPGFLADDLITPSTDPFLDFWGLAFQCDSTYLNIWGNASGNYNGTPGHYSFYTYDTNVGYTVTNTSDGVVATTTPEPGSLVLLCTGLASMGALSWMKKRNANAAAV